MNQIGEAVEACGPHMVSNPANWANAMCNNNSNNNNNNNNNNKQQLQILVCVYHPRCNVPRVRSTLTHVVNDLQCWRLSSTIDCYPIMFQVLSAVILWVRGPVVENKMASSKLLVNFCSGLLHLLPVGHWHHSKGKFVNQLWFPWCGILHFVHAGCFLCEETACRLIWKVLDVPIWFMKVKDTHHCWRMGRYFGFMWVLAVSSLFFVCNGLQLN